jgi:hypothetical protein
MVKQKSGSKCAVVTLVKPSSRFIHDFTGLVKASAKTNNEILEYDCTPPNDKRYEESKKNNKYQHQYININVYV